MYFLSKKTGKVYSSDELNGGYKLAKMRDPNLTKGYFCVKLTNEIELEPIDENRVVQELILAKRFGDAIAEWSRLEGIAIKEAAKKVAWCASSLGVCDLIHIYVHKY